jgi:RNA polymerase sigma-70 factor (ECF subfamily)
LTALVRRELAFVWRLLRRLGVPESEADDAAQQVFLVASRRLGDIVDGSERAFLFGTALNVSAKVRAARQRLPELDEELVAQQRDSTPGADDLLDRRRARELLDELLEHMSLELRVVFVLYEVEELTMAEIARVVGIPPGTVASRLRRARQDFADRVAALEAGTLRGDPT